MDVQCEIHAYIGLNGHVWGNVRGSDDGLIPKQLPPSDPDLQGGKRIDVFAGLKFLDRISAEQNQQLTLEADVPVYQYLDGPQLKTSWQASIQWAIAL